MHHVIVDNSFIKMGINSLLDMIINVFVGLTITFQEKTRVGIATKP